LQTGEALDSEARASGFDDMVEIALRAAFCD
jgi:purine-nucleoside phosphorylase